MAEVNSPKNELIEITKDQLLYKCMEMKKAGFRLSQTCAAYIDGKTELSYSFADDTTYDFITYRVVIDPHEEVPSITDIYPTATFYENEMAELSGVNVKMINLDYHSTLYRIKEETPLLPKEAR